jgi:hypothetical protein
LTVSTDSSQSCQGFGNNWKGALSLKKKKKAEGFPQEEKTNESL